MFFSFAASCSVRYLSVSFFLIMDIVIREKYNSHIIKNSKSCLNYLSFLGEDHIVTNMTSFARLESLVSLGEQSFCGSEEATPKTNNSK